MAPILTPEDVVRRIAAECTFVDPSNANDAGSGAVTIPVSRWLAEADWLPAVQVIKNCCSSDVTFETGTGVGLKVAVGPLIVCETPNAREVRSGLLL